MPHICGDEILALMMAMPFVGIAVSWVREKITLWWRRKP